MQRIIERSLFVQLIIPICVIILMTLSTLFTSFVMSYRIQRQEELAALTTSLSYAVDYLTVLVHTPYVIHPDKKSQETYATSRFYILQLSRIKMQLHQDNPHNLALIKSFSNIRKKWLDIKKEILNQTENDQVASDKSLSFKQTILEHRLSHLHVAINQLQRKITDSLSASERELQLVEIINAFVIISALSMLVYLIRMRLLIPMRRFGQIIDNFRRSRSNERLEEQSFQEFNSMCLRFNLLADNIVRNESNKNHALRSLNDHITRANEALNLIFLITEALNDPHPQRNAYKNIIERLDDLLSSTSMLVLVQFDTDSPPLSILTELPLCLREFRIIMSDESISETLFNPADPGSLVEKLIYNQTLFGWLCITGLHPAGITETQRLMAHTTAIILAMGLDAEHRIRESRRFAQIEERTAIARELHDSIAQSLSYLKIQVARLEQPIKINNPNTEMLSVIGELRDGLSSAYQNLRTLISTFRTRQTDPGLENSLHDLCNEFTERSSMTISLDYRLQGLALTPSEEMHTLQIIREALTNSVRHARANEVIIALALTDEQDVLIKVSDNGIGFDNAPIDTTQHHGMHIMQERAVWLSGTLHIDSIPGEGTHIILSYTPKSERNLIFGTLQ
ncbi:MAG: hypothetical protein KGI54_14370 [Pseudomonadota bacterium]|nr:hypothetical protein [Pseudomonadota bacterium]